PLGAQRERPDAPKRSGRLRTDAVEAIQALEKGQRIFRRRAGVDGGLQQAPRFLAVAAVEGRDAGLQQLLRLALPLGERAARALDVGARPRVAAIEKQRAGPHVDGLFVLRREVVIEAGEKKLLDL